MKGFSCRATDGCFVIESLKRWWDILGSRVLNEKLCES